MVQDMMTPERTTRPCPYPTCFYSSDRTFNLRRHLDRKHPGYRARHPCSSNGCAVCRLYGTPIEYAKTITMPQARSWQSSPSSAPILGLTPVSNQPIFFQCRPLDLTVSRHLVSSQRGAEVQPLDLSTRSVNDCRGVFTSSPQSPVKCNSFAPQHVYPGSCLETSMNQGDARQAKFPSDERYLMEGGYIFASDPQAFGECSALTSQPVFPKWKLDVSEVEP